MIANRSNERISMMYATSTTYSNHWGQHGGHAHAQDAGQRVTEIVIMNICSKFSLPWWPGDTIVILMCIGTR